MLQTYLDTVLLPIQSGTVSLHFCDIHDNVLWINNTTDGFNNFVNITADENSITCLFTKYHRGVTNWLVCYADIRYGLSCQHMLPEMLMGRSVLNDTVLITLESLPEVQEYCFIVTASDGTTIVKVEGSFTAQG